MRSDDILDQIDSALHDYTVSDDAMRSQPDPPAPPAPVPVVDMRSRTAPGTISLDGATPSVQIMDEAGEWQELGVVAVEIQITTPPQLEEFAQQWADFIDRMTRQRVEQARRAQEAFKAFARAAAAPMKRSVEEATRAFEALQQAAQQQEPPPAPVRRRDRPAWQSPYGPAQQRRR